MASVVAPNGLGSCRSTVSVSGTDVALFTSVWSCAVAAIAPSHATGLVFPTPRDDIAAPRDEITAITPRMGPAGARATSIRVLATADTASLPNPAPTDDPAVTLATAPDGATRASSTTPSAFLWPAILVGFAAGCARVLRRLCARVLPLRGSGSSAFACGSTKG